MAPKLQQSIRKQNSYFKHRLHVWMQRVYNISGLTGFFFLLGDPQLGRRSTPCLNILQLMLTKFSGKDNFFGNFMLVCEYVLPNFQGQQKILTDGVCHLKTTSQGYAFLMSCSQPFHCIHCQASPKVNMYLRNLKSPFKMHCPKVKSA